MGLDKDTDWRLQGPCSTLSSQEYDKLFFPEHGRAIKAAKEFCTGCPVSTICLEFALTHGCDGIWAGTNKEERKKMRQFVLPKTVTKIVEPVLAAVGPIKKNRKKTKKFNFQLV